MLVARDGRRVSEKLVAWIWQRQRLSRPLRCADGRVLQVVYPGRAWGQGRPDFQGALIAWEPGGLQRGDVEIHVRERDWRDHGHHRDLAYDGVVLHVVLERSPTGSTIASNGRTVPTLVLGPLLDGPIERLVADFETDEQPRITPCQDDYAAVTAMLEQAGTARFLDKAARFEGDLTALAPSEVLWVGVARALGYTANAEAMARLAERIPLSAVRELLALEQAGPDRHGTVLAALVGAAGLLPSQRGLWGVDPLGAALEERWRRLSCRGWRSVLSADAWELTRVRPANGPVRRLAGLACLGIQWLDADPARDLTRAVLGSGGRGAGLIGRFTVHAPEPAWARLLDLAGELQPPASRLVGRVRAVEVVANVVLPLVYALGKTWSLEGLSAAALSLFGRLPKAAESGLARNMALQLVGAGYRQVVTSAARQQGLLHLFRSSCDAHACAGCPAHPQGAHAPYHRSA